MKHSSNNRTLVIGVIVLALVGVGYFYISGTSAGTPAITASSTESAAQQKFQSLVAQLTPLSFDTKLFSDPRFTALTTIATPVASVPVGRADPFAPI